MTIFVPLMTLGILLYIMFTQDDTFSTYTHVGKNWLELAKQDNTKAQVVMEIKTHQPPLCNP